MAIMRKISSDNDSDIYVGLGEDPENNIVQKSNPLQTLAQTDLTLTDLKILDIYLSRIDSHNPEKRTVYIEKGVLESALGIERMRKDALSIRLKRLFQVVEIEDSRQEENLNLISLFEKATARKNEDGLWEIKLTCTEAAREYIFNIENLGYLSYRLKNILKLKSKYSYILFLWIEKEHKRLHKKSWEVSLDDLKEILCCKDVKSYERYYRFNEKVLKLAHDEINSKTQLKYSYEAVKISRTVKAVRFTVETVTKEGKNDIEKYYNDSISYEVENENVKKSEIADFYSEAEQSMRFYREAVPEFSDKEFSAIAALIESVPEDKLPETTPAGDSLDFRRYYYLKSKYASMISADAQNHISNKLAYFCRILANDSGM